MVYDYKIKMHSVVRNKEKSSIIFDHTEHSTYDCYNM